MSTINDFIDLFSDVWQKGIFGINASELEEGESKGYSVEQQLRLGCDDKGNMYKYSVVLPLHPKKGLDSGT